MIWLGCAPWRSSETSTAGTIALRQGGRTPGIDAETAKKLIRKDDDVEPVFYWCYPFQFHEDIARCLSSRVIVGLTLGDGALALAALLLEKPFVGVALTQDHRAGARLHLANCVFKGFMTEGTPFYDARIAQELQDAGVMKSSVISGPGGGAPAAKPKNQKAGVPKGGVPKKAGGVPPKKAAGVPPKAVAQKATPAKAKANNIQEKMKAAMAALTGGEGQDLAGTGGDGTEGEGDDGEEEEVNDDGNESQQRPVE